jgi:hypothetical protein
MINKIFWDIDNCLIFTDLSDPEQDHFKFNLEKDPNTYYTIVRPCAKRLIELSRQLVGKDNVYILTTSTRKYAEKINELAYFEFDSDHILTRETLDNHWVPTAYGGSTHIPHATLANEHNLLIDNLPPRYNAGKTNLIGITGNYEDRYLQVRDYYGVDYADDSFEDDVREFLITKYDKRGRETEE